MSAASLTARLNVFSHTLGFDTENARLVVEAADALARRTVQVFARSTYGQVRIYPANEIADIFLELTGNSTYSSRDLAVIRTLGYTVEQVPDPRMAVV